MAELKKLSYRDPTTGEEKEFHPVTEMAAVEGLEAALDAMLVDTALTGTPTAPTASQGTNNTQIATTAYVDTAVAAVNAAIASGVNVRGTLGTGGTVEALPSTDYKLGDMYVIRTAGTYAGQVCEVGDHILCVKAYEAEGASDADWSVIQKNIDRAITGPATAVADNIAVFDGATGTIVKDGGFKISDLQYTHPASGVTAGAYDRVTVDVNGHVTAGESYTAEQKLQQTGITSSAAEIDAAVDAATVTEVAVLGAEDEIPETLKNGGLIIRATA